MSDNDVTVVLIIGDIANCGTVTGESVPAPISILRAECRREALGLLDENIDVVLVERQLPGLTASQVLTEVLDRTDDCWVTVLTAAEPDTDFIAAGFDASRTKPISVTELQRLIETFNTRQQYETAIDQYYQLVSKQIAREGAPGTSGETDVDEDDLTAAVAALAETVDDLAAEFGREDFRVQFNRITENRSHGHDITEERQ